MGLSASGNLCRMNYTLAVYSWIFLDMSKRHGLWQFHHAIKGKSIRWWDGDLEYAQRVAARVSGYLLGGGFVPDEYTVWMIVNRCAYRYIRLYGLRKDADTWNRITDAICKRIQARPQTSKKVTCSERSARGKSLLIFENEFSLPRPKFLRCEVGHRLARFKAYQQTRCDLCGKPKHKLLWLNENGMIESGFAALYGYPQRYQLNLCEKHYSGMRRIAREAYKTDELRRELGKTKRQINQLRKQNESTEKHA
jgi:hypothetical protein